MNINEEANSQEKKVSEDQEINNLYKNSKIIDKEEANPQNEYYKLGWNKYSEITNGRFAMLGLLAIVIIELLSNKSFFEWVGIIN